MLWHKLCTQNSCNIMHVYPRNEASFRYIFVNTRYKGDNKDNNNNIITLYYSSAMRNYCRSQYSRGLRRPLVCWDCGFESHWRHDCLSVVSVVCCQVEVSATIWSLVQRSLTDCGASLCDLETLLMRRPWPRGGGCCVPKNT